MPRILVLVPTELERRLLMTLLRQRGTVDADLAAPMLCGFGPIAAAARTAGLIAQHSPDHLLLIGIAGTYDPVELPVGTACQFTEVACHGIGVGSGPSFLSASQLGWRQFPSRQQAGNVGAPELADCLPLQTIGISKVHSSGLLLTCCAAAADERDADERRQRYPGAIAEDMEGFGVALACAMSGVPRTIVRGISNRVGDRDHVHWRIELALSAAIEVADDLVQQIKSSERE